MTSIEKIEQLQDDSRRMFQAIKDLKSKEPQKPLLLQKENKTLTTNKEEQVKLISNFFEKLFADHNKRNHEY